MGRSRAKVLAATLFLWSSAGLAGLGCRRERLPDGRDGATALVHRVDPYAVQGNVTFHVVRWRICAEPVAGRTHEDLGRRALWTLSALRKTRCSVWTAMVAPDRVLLQIPADGWFRRSLDMVLTGADEAVLVDREAREYWQGGPGRLAAVLEGTGYRKPQEETIKFLDDKPAAGGGRGARTLQAVAERRQVCHRVVEFSLTYRPNASLSPDQSHLLLRALTLVTGIELDQKNFVELAKRVPGLVTKLRVRSRCVSWPVDRKAMTWTAVIEGVPARMSLPANRAAVPPVEAQRRHGPLSPGPLAYVDPKRLDLLRSWTGKLGPICPLLVSNKSDRSAVIFADGFPLGILSASTTISFEGLACGYHRLAAASPLGVISWGPVDTYVAGAWTLH